MAGHNKWSKIKHKKAVVDAKKSKEFGKLSLLLAIESKKAGGDKQSPALRLAIERARKANMPNDNINRAIAKGTATGGNQIEEVVYETYGPGGVAILAVGVTDNNNRTASEIRHLLSKEGCALAQPGSASWAFTKEGDGYTPTTKVALQEEDAKKLAKLLVRLEELEDVQALYTNSA